MDNLDEAQCIQGAGGGGGGGQQGQDGGGVELGPRWQNFRYLRCATLTAVLLAPALPPEHREFKTSTFHGQ